MAQTDPLDYSQIVGYPNYLPSIPNHKRPLITKYYIKPYNRYRRAKLIMFIYVLEQHTEFCNLPTEEQYLLVENLERSCLNYTLDKAKEYNNPIKWNNETFQNIYTTICAKISSNIDQTNNVQNTFLTSAILNKTVNIKELPRMTSQDLYPEKYKSVLIKLEASKNVKQTIKTSAMYKCKRCHKSECTIENRYNRSLDEGVNLTINCVACGHEWNG